MPMRDLEVFELRNIFHRVALWRGLDSAAAGSFASDCLLQLWRRSIREDHGSWISGSSSGGTADIAGS